jgi:hypothetical protein
VSRFRERAKLQRPIAPNQLVEPSVLAKMNNVTIGDTVSALQFMQKYGTHYINSYVTGNSLYQVANYHCLYFLINLDIMMFASLGFCFQQKKLSTHQGKTEITWCIIAFKK